MVDVARFPYEGLGRCSAVSFNGMVYAVATDTSSADGITEQTRRTLAQLDETLKEAGSGKPGLLQVTIYLSDISDKPEMDRIWLEWIGDRKNWPQRACVGAQLANDDLIEIVVLAAQL